MRDRYDFGGNKIYMSCTPLKGSGTVPDSGYSIETTHGQYASFVFFIGDNIDDNADILMTFLLSSNEADATEDMTIYIEARKSDNSEAAAWNVENGTAFTFDSFPAEQLSKYQYTLSASDYEVGDGIIVSVMNNTTTATVKVLNCTIELTVK